MTKEEFEKQDLIYLAVQCGEVAKRPPADSSIAEKAWQLRREALLFESQQPPPQAEQKNTNARKEELRGRIAEFLSAVL